MSATDASQQANRAGMDPKRLVVIAYLGLGLIVAVFFANLFDQIAVRIGVGNGKLLEGLDWKYSHLVALAATIGLAAYLWTNPRTKSVSLEVAGELMKVTWPSFEETRVSTLAVVVASLVASILLFGIDTLCLKVMVDWLPMIWGKL